MSSEWSEEPNPGSLFGYAIDALEDVGQWETGAPYAHAIAVGAPGFDVRPVKSAGWVGLIVAVEGETRMSSVTQSSIDVPGAPETGDRFGAAVSLNYLIGAKGIVDLAVGVPGEDIGSVADAGSVTIVQDLYDWERIAVAIDQNSAGVPGAAEAGDQFGRSLDSVNVDSNSSSWLAIGVPGEDIGSRSNAGSVQLFRSNETTLKPRTALSQDTSRRRWCGGVR